MSLLESLFIWPNRPLPSLLVLLVLLMPFLYAAREPMHALLRSMCRSIARDDEARAGWPIPVCVCATATAKCYSRMAAMK